MKDSKLTILTRNLVTFKRWYGELGLKMGNSLKNLIFKGRSGAHNGHNGHIYPNIFLIYLIYIFMQTIKYSSKKTSG